MWIAAILSVIAGLVSAYGTKKSADAQQEAANFNAAAAKQNADTANQQAAFDAQQIRNKNRRVLAAQRAAVGASGLDFSGSATDVSADSAAQGEMDAMIAIYTGQTAAHANTTRASLFQMEGRAAKQAGKIGVVTSILGGASSAYSGYAKNPAPKNPTIG